MHFPAAFLFLTLFSYSFLSAKIKCVIIIHYRNCSIIIIKIRTRYNVLRQAFISLLTFQSREGYFQHVQVDLR